MKKREIFQKVNVRIFCVVFLLNKTVSLLHRMNAWKKWTKIYIGSFRFDE